MIFIEIPYEDKFQSFVTSALEALEAGNVLQAYSLSYLVLELIH